MQYEVGGGQIGRREAFARAEPLYAKALQLDQGLVEARLGLANVARQYQRYDEARRTYEAVISEHPNNIQARFGLGITEEDDGWPSRAVVQYERAAALDPTHFLIPIRAGLAMMYLGRLAEAEARFKRSIELDSARPNGFYSLGILNWLRGRLDESVAAHREALKRGDQAAVHMDMTMRSHASTSGYTTKRGVASNASRSCCERRTSRPSKRHSSGWQKARRNPRRKCLPIASRRPRRGSAC